LQSAGIRIGTRGSPLALIQAELVRRQLADLSGLDANAVEIVPLRTTGDRITDRPLSEAGGKGLFTKEIDEALLAGRIDVGVHSAKDMATRLPDGIVIAACLTREDPRDAFISPAVKRLVDLPHGARIGTSSLRRRALALRLRPDLSVVDLRGNVDTRRRQIETGGADATMLALLAERAFLGVLDGSCRTPIGGLARVAADKIFFAGIILKPDGREAHEVHISGPASTAEAIGIEAGAQLAERGGSDFFADV
jgi:hydroxymethylbilane synthase